MTMIKVSAFRWVPPFAQGLVRDLRVRWALEEAGLPYEERLIGPADQKSDGYRALQPFGQVPSYEENGLELFESGAIVLHIAERAESLMPPRAGRARTNQDLDVRSAEYRRAADRFPQCGQRDARRRTVTSKAGRRRFG